MSDALLSGEVAVITGASRGIGRAAAEALAQAGAAVMLAARDGARVREAAERIRAGGGQAEYRVCDVADWDAVRALADETARRLGAIRCWSTMPA